MFKKNIYKPEFIEELKNSQSVFLEDSANYIIRCPFCGDSKRHLNKGHMNISKYEPVYHCVRCDEARGHIFKLSKLLLGYTSPKKIIRDEFLEEISFRDKKVYNKDIFKTSFLDLKESVGLVNEKSKDYIRSRIQNHEIPYMLNNIIIDSKEAKDITIKQSVLPSSEGSDVSARKEYLRELINDYIGFLGDRKSFVSFRRISNDNKKLRYIVIKLTNNSITDFITFHNKPIYYNKIPKIVLAEGIFDIMNAMNKLDLDDTNIFLVCRKSFYKVPMYLKIFKNIFYADYTILADSSEDIKPKKLFYSMKRNKMSKNMVGKLTVKRNKNFKDFGDYIAGNEGQIETFVY